jgi:hypothetical protein
MTLIQTKVGLVIKAEARENMATYNPFAPSDAVQISATPLIDFATGRS